MSPLPWIKLKSAAAGPQAFRRMIGETDPKARPGDVVQVLDKNGAPYGVALYNPKSLISLRLLTRDFATFDPDTFFEQRLSRALEMRQDIFKLDDATNAYRVVHDLGDGLPGLVIDRYDDHFVIEFYSLGMFRQAKRIESVLTKKFPGAKFVHRASQYTETMEGFEVEDDSEQVTRVRENGVQFEVHLARGYKTGFFCDQRDNRLAVSKLAAGRRMIDICSYTGGFGIYAKKLGGAKEVTCVELDPEVSAWCQRNANINQVSVNAVCVDAFPYLRQMAANNEKYDLVVLDPYKLISSRDNYDFGRKKYIDFNRLALSLVAEGGLYLTCSCSGLLQWDEFAQIVRTAAGSAGRRAQIFHKSGAGIDHPVAADFPEGEYLKAIWCRVF